MRKYSHEYLVHLCDEYGLVKAADIRSSDLIADAYLKLYRHFGWERPSDMSPLDEACRRICTHIESMAETA